MEINAKDLMEAMEKKLGDFITTGFVALVVLGISIWILRFIVNEALLPLISGLGEINVQEASFWSIANVLFVVFLFLMVIGGIYLAITISKARKASKKLQKDQLKTTEQISTLASAFSNLKEAEKQLENRAKEVQKISDDTLKNAEKLREAQDDFERIQRTYGHR